MVSHFKYDTEWYKKTIVIAEGQCESIFNIPYLHACVYSLSLSARGESGDSRIDTRYIREDRTGGFLTVVNHMLPHESVYIF